MRGLATGARGRSVTMQDIARAVGVSQSTVSRVLSGTESSVPIAADTRERVVAEANRLGFHPNPLARALRGAPTMLLGLIVREITDPFFSVAVEEISEAARLRGYNVVLGTAHSRAEEAIALRSVLEARQCDAIVVIGDMQKQPRMLEDLANAHVPVVAMFQGSDLPAVPVINADNHAGICTALEHLYSWGHSKIALVAGQPFAAVQERRSAYSEWMEQHGLAVPAPYVQLRPNNPAGGEAALQTLLEAPEPPSAVICTTDLLAIGVLHAAAARGVVVPTDLSVMGFDDLPISAYLVPALTTLHIPIHEMAVHAVEIAVGDAGREPVTEVYQPSLVVRSSTTRHTEAVRV